MRTFGSRRSEGARTHAACDLYAPVGTPIFAIADGGPLDTMVLRDFYLGTWRLEVHHPGIGVVRYGEIMPPDQWRRNQAELAREFAKSKVPTKGRIEPPTFDEPIKEGDLIAAVGRLDGYKMSMLHFELYGEEASGQPLSQPARKGYERHPALLDPTRFLLGLQAGRLTPGTPPAPPRWPVSRSKAVAAASNKRVVRPIYATVPLPSALDPADPRRRA
jgi:hypothetical protein